MRTDLLGQALLDIEPGHPLIIEREDGHRSVADLSWWRREPQSAAPADVEVLDWIATGESVVDVGCATGVHLGLLYQRGVKGYGIEMSHTAVRAARAGGVAAVVADARHWSPAQPVDVALALGGGAGICGSLADLPIWLKHLASWLTPAGRVIVTSVDWRVSNGHETWVADARSRGRYPGEVQLRLLYRDLVGPWFQWLWVDSETLTEVAAPLGLTLGRTAAWGAKYAVELRKNARQP